MGIKKKNRAKPMQGPERPPFAPVVSPSIDGLIFLLQPSPQQKRQHQQINHPHHLATGLAFALALPIPLRANEQRSA
jgi:hypothetical protein